MSPLRDLFAAMFFFFLGLEIDPASLLPALPFAARLGIATAFTKMITGNWAAHRAGIDRGGRLRAGMELVARGEFSIVIAGLGAAIEPRLGSLSAAYVLLMAKRGLSWRGSRNEGHRTIDPTDVVQIIATVSTIIDDARPPCNHVGNLEFVNGRLVEATHLYDTLGTLRQLGRCPLSRRKRRRDSVSWKAAAFHH
jgi:Kef-type K+ transport system membrane component KefB